MRIGLDLHTFSDLMQGSRTYMVNLARTLPGLAPEHEFTLFVPDPGDPVARREFAAPNVRLAAIPHSRPARLLYPFPARARAMGLDVLHCQYIAPLAPCAPCVVSIHDIIHETRPEFYPGGLGRLMRLLYPLSARRAAMVLTISAASLADILARYKVDPARAAYAHPGVSAEFAPVTDPGRLEAVRDKYRIKAPYILFVGRVEPRKNLDALLAAFAMVRPDHPDLSLVVAGMKDRLFAGFHDRMVAKGLTGGVTFTGKVDQKDLPALYSGSLAFAYPSFAEGFGLPPLEAMACGAAVVTSNTTSLPEVVGEAGIMVDPADVAALAGALSRLASDPALRERLGRAGRERAAGFTWEPAARLALRAYAAAAGGPDAKMPPAT